MLGALRLIAKKTLEKIVTMETQKMQKNRCGQDWHDLMTWEEYLIKHHGNIENLFTCKRS